MIQLCILGSLSWDTCAKNPGGLLDTVYFGEVADIDTFPAVDSTPAALGDDCVTTGDIEMAVGKKMYELYITQDTGELSDDLVGEIDGMSYESTFEAFSPGTHKEMLGFSATVANGNFFLAIPERGGNYRLFGGPGYPAKLISGSIKTGKDAKGRKGFTFKFKTFGPTPCPIYTSKVIPLS
jgi:hypothetical protein